MAAGSVIAPSPGGPRHAPQLVSASQRPARPARRDRSRVGRPDRGPPHSHRGLAGDRPGPAVGGSDVKTQVATVADRIRGELQVAQGAFAERGAVSFGPPETWTVTPQGTGVASEVAVPRLLIGGLGLGHNADTSTPTPIVDDIARLLGASVTVLPRVDAAGTMLRVATNVKTAAGARAIGTVIDPSYVAAYAPVMRGADVIGALFVGIPQASVDGPLRAALASMTVAEHGYLTVLAADGSWVVPPPGGGTGSALTATDAFGKPYAQRIIDFGAGRGRRAQSGRCRAGRGRRGVHARGPTVLSGRFSDRRGGRPRGGSHGRPAPSSAGRASRRSRSCPRPARRLA
jgi:hypothetical protein